ncbi:MAG: glycoside hydrolase family 16 protein [Breznakibacter sp.]
MKTANLIIFFISVMPFTARPQPTPLYPNELKFAGFTWGIKAHAEAMGPGSNLFGLHKKNVYVDRHGRLNLSIRKTKHGWSCAELASHTMVHNGKYEFTIETDISRLKPNMVVGLFLYNDLNPPAYDEIDIEFSRWGRPEGKNAQFVVHQKGKFEKNRFSIPKGIKKSTHSIEITNDSIIFTSKWTGGSAGHITAKPPSFSLTGLRIRLNLWLCQPCHLPVRYPKVVVSGVTYTPARPL